MYSNEAKSRFLTHSLDDSEYKMNFKVDCNPKIRRNSYFHISLNAISQLALIDSRNSRIYKQHLSGTRQLSTQSGATSSER